MCFYLSGPMTGIEDRNFPAFNEAAHYLRTAGIEVYNPAENPIVEDESKTFDDFMAIDLAEVCKSDGIVLLPGWLMSKGACLEYFVADYLGKPAWEYAPTLETRMFTIAKGLVRRPFVVAAEVSLDVERKGLQKHEKDGWFNEIREKHTLKAARHIMSHELTMGGFIESEESHLENALCRLAMALAQTQTPHKLEIAGRKDEEKNRSE